ncbi:MAG: hypothetical protein ACK5QX_10370 [bacterium]|jgi:DNA-binding XRE family transcriptional regulator
MDIETAESQPFSEKKIGYAERLFYEKISKTDGERACIAEALRRFRVENCLSQGQAAAECGVDRTSWGAWERKSRSMQPMTKFHLCSTGSFAAAHFGAIAF